MEAKTSNEQTPKPPEEKELKQKPKSLTVEQQVASLQNQVNELVTTIKEINQRQDSLTELFQKLNKYEEGGRVYTKLYDEEGGVYEIASQAIHPEIAWHNMIELVYTQNKNGFSSAPFSMKKTQTDDDPATASVTKANKAKKINAIIVQSIAVKLDQRNQRYLRVFGGYGSLDYLTNGLPAFEQAIPKEFKQSFNSMVVDARVKPPDFMEVAVLDPSNNRVKFFRARKDKEPQGDESQEIGEPNE